MTAIDPRDKSPSPGDGGFTNPRVFDTIEQAVAAQTSEESYLEELDTDDQREEN